MWKWSDEKATQSGRVLKSVKSKNDLKASEKVLEVKGSTVEYRRMI